MEAFFSDFDDLVRAVRPVGRLLDPDDERQLDAFCYVLALFDTVYRTGQVHHSSPLRSLPTRPTTSDLLALAEDPWLEDLQQMAVAAYRHLYKAFENFSAVINPTFEGSRDVGAADADLIIDGCLVEIKSSTAAGLSLRRLWIFQLLGYVLLDYSDRFRITSVALYLPRHCTLVRWSLADLLADLGITSDLRQLRADFRRALSASSVQ